MTIFTWSFPQFDVAKAEDGLTDVVKTIHWRYDAVDGDYSASTTFITFLNPGIYGSLVLVWGSDGTNRFFDLVMCSLGTGSVTVVSSMTAGGTPSARSYQQGSSQFQMKVASGTYTVQASAFSIGF